MRRIRVAGTALLLASCKLPGISGNETANGAPGNEARQHVAATGSISSGTAVVQPGQWEMRTEVRQLAIRNMPTGAPPTTLTHCMTPEQAERLVANALTGTERNGNCTYQNFSVRGDRFSGTAQCTRGGAQARTTMDGRFTATSYEFIQRLQVVAGGITSDMELRTTGRRLGDCPPQARKGPS